MNPCQYIKQGIYAMGGPTQASFELRVSANTIHKWIKHGRIPRLDQAEKVSAASHIAVDQLRPV